MVLGTDLGGGNVDISLFSKGVFDICFFMFLFIFYVICFWSIGTKTHNNIVVILGGQNVDMMLGFIRFSEMNVFFAGELFERII